MNLLNNFLSAIRSGFPGNPLGTLLSDTSSNNNLNQNTDEKDVKWNWAAKVSCC